jgi:hypothetical protein
MDGLIVHREVERPPHFAFVFAVVLGCHPSPQAEDLLLFFVVAFRCCLYV